MKVQKKSSNTHPWIVTYSIFTVHRFNKVTTTALNESARLDFLWSPHYSANISLLTNQAVVAGRINHHHIFIQTAMGQKPRRAHLHRAAHWWFTSAFWADHRRRNVRVWVIGAPSGFTLRRLLLLAGDVVYCRSQFWRVESSTWYKQILETLQITNKIICGILWDETTNNVVKRLIGFKSLTDI